MCGMWMLGRRRVRIVRNRGRKSWWCIICCFVRSTTCPWAVGSVKGNAIPGRRRSLGILIATGEAPLLLLLLLFSLLSVLRRGYGEILALTLTPVVPSHAHDALIPRVSLLPWGGEKVVPRRTIVNGRRVYVILHVLIHRERAAGGAAAVPRITWPRLPVRKLLLIFSLQNAAHVARKLPLSRAHGVLV